MEQGAEHGAGALAALELARQARAAYALASPSPELRAVDAWLAKTAGKPQARRRIEATQALK
jgi:hypothetical protein